MANNLMFKWPVLWGGNYMQLFIRSTSNQNNFIQKKGCDYLSPLCSFLGNL